jgi:glycosidase
MMFLKQNLLKAALTSGVLMASTALSSATVADGGLSDIRPENMRPYLERPITDDIMYFVMPDRFFNGDKSNDHGGIKGDPIDHGFDPTHKGFYHGGDIKGVTAKLDYLADMGISAIWMTPIFKNKPTQGNIVNVTSGYHGYWITDFTQIDPHLGTNDDLKELVREAHARNIKVIFDIITNHTADVIKYEECFPRGSDPKNVPLCDYRSKEDYPYTTVGKADGAPINPGFEGDDVAGQTAANFAKLTNNNFAYTPYIPAGEEDVKVPAWLNNKAYYHNRGDSEWKGESSLYGDFAGLDDLFTEHPDVVKGLTEIYKFWISEFKIDGFRIDTVRHVNDSFWQSFGPAIQAHAKSEGIKEFYTFGEVFNPDPKYLSHFTTVAKLPSVLDFGFQSVATKVIAENAAPAALAALYAQDPLYKGEFGDASILPTFLGNHDMGRFGHFIDKSETDVTSDTALKKTQLAHALMYFTRGVPVIYYGDEQGFVGDGGDQDAREDMFASMVASFNDNANIGGGKSTAVDNFDTAHPLYKTMQELARIRGGNKALRGGSQQVLAASNEPGIFAVLRENEGELSLAIFNTAEIKASASLEETALTNGLCLIGGQAGETTTENNKITYTAPAHSWAVYAVNECD